MERDGSQCVDADSIKGLYWEIEIKQFQIKNIELLMQDVSDDIEKIGIAFPGTVSNGVVVKADNLGIENFNIVKELKKEFNCALLTWRGAKKIIESRKNNE